MKNITYFVLFCLFSFSITITAQNKTVWFDANWNITSKDSASFYRPAPIKKGNAYLMIDYYMSGMRQFEGISLKSDEEVFEGQVTWYFESGKVFQKGNYKNGLLNGELLIFHESGSLKNKIHYLNNQRDGSWIEYFEDGTLKEMGSYINGKKDGMWALYYKSKKIKSEGEYGEGKRKGVWKSYYYEGEIEE